jgi:hypothetical protein
MAFGPLSRSHRFEKKSGRTHGDYFALPCIADNGTSNGNERAQ